MIICQMRGDYFLSLFCSETDDASETSGDKKVAALEWKGWNYLYCKVKQFPDAKNPF
jgi:hypothetical protein